MKCQCKYSMTNGLLTFKLLTQQNELFKNIIKMRKASNDHKVKKTLLRNYEKRVSKERNVVRDVDSNSSECVKKPLECYKESQLGEPTLCTSEALANYLVELRASAPPPITSNDLNTQTTKISSKITKKLNFHFNDRMYKNLVELNSDVLNLKSKKDKKVKSTTSLKKDLEPCIEDFSSNEKENDEIPNIPSIKQKYKPVKKIEDGSLHRLVASFEKL